MKLIGIAELKAKGWRGVSRKVPRDLAPGYEWEYDLFDPDGKLVATDRWEDGAWAKCPLRPEDGFHEDYAWVADKNVELVDPHDEEAIEAIEDEYGQWGRDRIVLTPSDLDALRGGKCIVWGQNEYTSIILFHDEDDEA